MDKTAEEQKDAARDKWFGDRSQTSTLVAMNAADGFNAGFEAGYKAASGRVSELEDALDLQKKITEKLIRLLPLKTVKQIHDAIIEAKASYE